MPARPQGMSSPSTGSAIGSIIHPMASILVTRVESGWRDRFHSYKVLIDGREAGRLKRGESVLVDLPPGRHVIQVAIEWKRSKSFEVLADGDETSTFRCGPRAGIAVIDLLRRGDDTWLFLEPDVA